MMKSKHTQAGLIQKLSGRSSIKRKLQLGIAALAAVISILFGTVSTTLLYRDASNNTKLRIEETTAAHSQSVQNAIQVYKTRIEAIAQDSSVWDPGKTQEEKNEAMTGLAKDYGFDSVMVADSNGNTMDNVMIGERDYFKEAMAGNTYLSSTLVSAKDGKTILVVSSKIKSSAYDGIVFALLDSSTFSTMIDGISIGESGYGLIADKTGKIIAHKNKELVTRQLNYIEMAQKDDSYAEAAAVVQNMIAGKTGIQSGHLEGNQVTAGYTGIPGTDGWSIGVFVRTAELMQNFYLSIAVTVIFVVLFVIASFFFAKKIADPIVNPIISMVRRLELLTEGDLHTEVPQYHTEDEIGTLSASLTYTVNALSSIIGETASVLSSLEKGDCTVTSKLEYSGDFIRLKTALNGIISNLNTIFSSFRTSINQVALGADQVSSAAQSLASGASEQAATVEELNASVAGVAQQAEENAAAVRQANEYAKQTGKEVARGNAFMQSLNTAMDEIGESSQKISSITKVIEDIAFQTNILALNAAIEAARAGDVGKGFAVVADEVRTLAGKVSEAAKQTSALILHSAEVVADGEKLSKETAEVLKTVADKAGLVEQSMAQVGHTSEEQAQAMEQINIGLSQVSSVIQTNAATAEESSASSEELAAQAQSMQKEIDWIRLKED
ncbi:methyl-accepting chemotaxis protein [Lachnospiraceae bacterium 54-53]